MYWFYEWKETYPRVKMRVWFYDWKETYPRVNISIEWYEWYGIWLKEWNGTYPRVKMGVRFYEWKGTYSRVKMRVRFNKLKRNVSKSKEECRLRISLTVKETLRYYVDRISHQISLEITKTGTFLTRGWHEFRIWRRKVNVHNLK